MSLRAFPNDQFFAIVESEIRSGKSLELKVKGSSMHPALKDGRHKVVLAPLRQEYLRTGMIALFAYRGKHVLHRLVGIDGDTLTFQGDNLPHKKEVVTRADVVAWVEHIITPDGRVVDCKKRSYRIRSRALVFANRFTAIPRVKAKGLVSRILRIFRHRVPAPENGAARRTKVLFFIESLAGGGAERILSIVADHLDKERFDMTVCCVTAEGVYAGHVGNAVRLKPLIRTTNRFLYKVLYHLIYYILPPWLVCRLFLPKGNDVEVAFCEGFTTKLLSRSPAKRKIAWVHIDLIANPWTQRLVYPSVRKEREAYSKFDNVICVSEKVRESFETKFGLSATTIYNPVDSGRIVALSEKEHVPRGPVTRFVTTGRLVHQKGYDRLLKVAGMLRDDGHSFELWILGDGVDRDSLTTYIRENRLEKHVKLWGFVTNPYPYVASGDVFVCSSRSEGYSTAATEAIILGIPVITTLCAGMDELLGADGRYGCIVGNEDTALYDPMKRALTDPAFLEELKDKARVRSGDFQIGSLMGPIECLLQ